jgi:hypothetical protein
MNRRRLARSDLALGLLCLAAASVWPISHFVGDWCQIQIWHRQFTFLLGPGWFTFTDTPSLQNAVSIINDRRFLDDALRQRLAFPRVYSASGDYHFYAPLWLVTLSSGVFAVMLFVSHRRNRPVEEGRCAVCGYDLRATPDRCPECGAATRKGGVAAKSDNASSRSP